MNFFEHQVKARRNTKRLVVLFVLAVAMIILALYFVGLAIALYLDIKHAMRGNDPEWTWWRPDVLGYVAALALGVIGIGSLWKIRTLAGGGSAVAASLGGKWVNPETGDAAERRLLNVVEEMAIAAGVAVPMVFVLDKEDGLNAFAAGYSPNDAAIAVTRGALRLLNRDELQGVIAHEFSHVLNGDMRLNIRLIGLLHGILVIGIIGTLLMRSVAYSGGHRSRRSGGKAALAALVVGGMLSIIGYTGIFFGRLIKAAASRQREFLADASAVNFTRNPDGIAGALKKIGGFSRKSTIISPAAEQASHMFFGDAMGKRLLFANALATHPPLGKRIHRIDPSFDGAFPRVKPIIDKPTAAARGAAVAGLHAGETVTADAASIVDRVGTPTIDHLAYGAALIASMPQTVRAAAHDQVGAVVMVYALLLDADEAVRSRQLDSLRPHCEQVFIEETLRLRPGVAALDPGMRLPLVDLALPALRGLSLDQYRCFRRNVKLLVEADHKISIFEFALHKVLLHRLAASFGRAGRKRPRYGSLTPLLEDCRTLLSILARVGHPDEDAADRAYQAGTSRLSPQRHETPAILPVASCDFKALDQALDRLMLASPVIKERVIDACARCALADGTVTVTEAELLRAVTDVLDCPLPPFLPSVGAERTAPDSANKDAP